MQIVLLADIPEMIPKLGAWFREDWTEPDAGRAGDPEDDFRGCAQRDRLPVNLVALDRGEPVGTVFVLDHVDRADPALGPWIEGLFVIPERRHEGLALFLVEGAVALARRLGYPRVNMGVRAAAAYYEAAGWREVGRIAHAGGPVVHLARPTAPLAGRQEDM